MRIAIFGGSFDPIHNGHAMLANYVSQYSGVDEVWLMPSPLNPLKCDVPPVDFIHRLEMCRIVAEKCCRVRVSDFERELTLPSYTYRTLCMLREAYPGNEFTLLIGSDNLAAFSRWRNPDEIISEFGLLVYPRPGYPVKEIHSPGIELIEDAPVADISSTFIRQALRNGKNLAYLLDNDVIRYIYSNSLYLNA